MSKHHRNPKRPAARRQGKPTTTVSHANTAASPDKAPQTVAGAEAWLRRVDLQDLASDLAVARSLYRTHPQLITAKRMPAHFLRALEDANISPGLESGGADVLRPGYGQRVRELAEHTIATRGTTVTAPDTAAALHHASLDTLRETMRAALEIFCEFQEEAAQRLLACIITDATTHGIWEVLHDHTGRVTVPPGLAGRVQAYVDELAQAPNLDDTADLTVPKLHLAHLKAAAAILPDADRQWLAEFLSTLLATYDKYGPGAITPESIRVDLETAEEEYRMHLDRARILVSTYGLTDRPEQPRQQAEQAAV